MHVGRLIETIVRSQGRSPSWLARQLNMVRVNVYDIFRRETIDSGLLRRISLVLGEDLFGYLSEDLRRSAGEKDDAAAKKSGDNSAVQRADNR